MAWPILYVVSMSPMAAMPWAPELPYAARHVVILEIAFKIDDHVKRYSDGRCIAIRCSWFRRSV